MKKAVIFDMDGTLWDSVDNIVISWNNVCAQYPEENLTITRAQMMSLMGKTMDKFAEALFPHLPGERGLERLYACETAENEYLREHGGELYADVGAVFQKLKEMGYGVYIVSNCQAGYIESFLAHYQWEHLVDDFECYGNNDLEKADNLKLLIKRNALEKYYYVGDTQGDYDACQKAGVPFVFASYGFGTVDDDVLKIDSLEQITEILK